MSATEIACAPRVCLFVFVDFFKHDKRQTKTKPSSIDRTNEKQEEIHRRKLQK